MCAKFLGMNITYLGDHKTEGYSTMIVPGLFFLYSTLRSQVLTAVCDALVYGFTHSIVKTIDIHKSIFWERTNGTD